MFSWWILIFSKVRINVAPRNLRIALHCNLESTISELCNFDQCGSPQGQLLFFRIAGLFTNWLCSFILGFSRSVVWKSISGSYYLLRLLIIWTGIEMFLWGIRFWQFSDLINQLVKLLFTKTKGNDAFFEFFELISSILIKFSS